MSFFDQDVERQNTQSIKWDIYGKDVLPFWVADMDFLSAPEIAEAIKERASHNVYGYTKQSDELTNVIVERLWKLYDWKIDPSWIVYTPAVVSSVNVFCHMMEGERNEVACFTPVYYCLMDAPVNAGKKLVKVPLNEKNNWSLDSGILLNNISAKTQGVLLCNPHNPIGRVFSEKELTDLIDVCINNDIYICSDEIHCDLILDETKKHIPIASLSKEAADRTVTLMSPGKIFNTPGLSFAFAVIPNKTLRKNFIKKSKGIVPFVNIFGYQGAMAAYKYGDKWLKELIPYLNNNFKLLKETVDCIDGVDIVSPEATYMAWIDIRKRSDITVDSFIKNGIALSDGAVFDGKGFVRFNFATSLKILKEGLCRFEKTFE